MSETIITESEARSLRMKPITRASHIKGSFLRNVIRDMRRVPKTKWAVVKPAGGQFRDSPEMVEIWRVMVPPL